MREEVHRSVLLGLLNILNSVKTSVQAAVLGTRVEEKEEKALESKEQGISKGLFTSFQGLAGIGWKLRRFLRKRMCCHCKSTQKSLHLDH